LTYSAKSKTQSAAEKYGMMAQPQNISKHLDTEQTIPNNLRALYLKEPLSQHKPNPESPNYETDVNRRGPQIVIITAASNANNASAVITFLNKDLTVRHTIE
jgi:hypothetical protein